MNTMMEGALRITVPPEARWRRFDDGAVHGLSHCMKAVDFIVDLPDQYLFVECKDPDHPAAQELDRTAFMAEFSSGALDQALKSKCRDSFLYEWASGRADKPIRYLVLIAAAALSAADLLRRTEALKRVLPLSGPKGSPWRRPPIAECAVLNIDTWNRLLPRYKVARVST